jgi:hypothetical protein
VIGFPGRGRLTSSEKPALEQDKKMVKLRNQKTNPLFLVLSILESPFRLQAMSIEAGISFFQITKTVTV